MHRVSRTRFGPWLGWLRSAGRRRFLGLPVCWPVSCPRADVCAEVVTNQPPSRCVQYQLAAQTGMQACADTLLLAAADISRRDPRYLRQLSRQSITGLLGTFREHLDRKQSRRRPPLRLSDSWSIFTNRWVHQMASKHFQTGLT